jgi:hypothetical protein
MAGRIIVGILQRRHADHIVRPDGTRVLLAPKPATSQRAIGANLTLADTLKKDATTTADNIWCGGRADWR